MSKSGVPIETRKLRVFIIGGGFGGIAAAKALHDADCHVIIIDRRNYHVFQPLLYQVASSALSPADISAPIRTILRGQKNSQVALAEVQAIDITSRKILLDGGYVNYDYLILAAGANHTYFGHPEWHTYAPGLKTLEDATEIRRRILLAYESAEYEGSEQARQAALTFAIVGGGPTGVELAGAIMEIAGRTLPEDYRNIDTRTTRVIIFQAADRLLPHFSHNLSRQAKTDLESLGVEIRLKSKVVSVTEHGVQVISEHQTNTNEFIPIKTVFWAAGVIASKISRSLGVPLDHSKRVIVNQDLTIPDHSNVFVIGDMAHAKSADTGLTVPGVAQGAIQMGYYVGNIIKNELKAKTRNGDGDNKEIGDHERHPFSYHDKGSMAVIGRRKAIAQIGEWEFTGIIAWWLWGIIHIAFLINFRNRLLVLTSWFLNWLYNSRDARIITGDTKIDIKMARPNGFIMDSKS